MTFILTTSFAYFIEMFSAAMMLSNVYNLKRKMPAILFIGTLMFSFPTIVFLFIDHLYINMVVFFITNFIFAYFLFECSWFSAIILAMVLDAGMVGTEFLTMNFLTILFDTELKDYKSTDYMYFLLVFISKIMYFLMCQFISHFGFLIKEKTSKNKEKIKSKTPIFLLIYPLCTMFACGLFWKMSLEYQFTRNVNIFVVLICVFFLVSIVATYLLYNQTAKKEAEVYKLQAEVNRGKIDQEYYKILDYQNEELKTLVHDEKNHLSVIKSLADSPEVDNYIDKIYSDLKRYSSSGKTKNKMLDLIINKYSLLCETENIDFYVNIHTSNLSFMSDAELTTMLSNILDNAVESAKKSEAKTIDLSINNVSGHDMLTCVNSCDTKPVSDSGVLKTTKEDKKFHGIGTKSIKRIADKYSGEYDWDYDEDKKEFSTFVMFGVK